MFTRRHDAHGNVYQGRIKVSMRSHAKRGNEGRGGYKFLWIFR